MPTIELPSGPIHYRVAGPEDSTLPPVIFVHAFLVDGTVWSEVAERLAAQGIRSYAPDWPLGAHREPLHADADQSPRGIARLILQFLETLGLDQITLVGNDTGGALAQFVLDTDPSRIGRLVLTNCDAFGTFPPFPFNVVFRLLAGERRMKLNLLPMRMRGFRHSPLGFGPLAHRLDATQTRSWVEPAITDPRIRRGTVRFLRAVDPVDLLSVSTRLKDYRKPVRIVWGTGDRAFTPALGRRLQQAFHDAEFVEVPNARTFVQIDAPQVLARQIAELTGAHAGA